MAINLLEKLQSEVGDSVSKHSANFFDEKEEPTGKAVKGTFAAIIAGMIQRVSYDKGAKSLHKLLKNEDAEAYDIENIFTRSPQTVNGLVNRGAHFLPSIYPGRLREATNSVSADSGVRKVTSSKMMKVCAPLMLGTLGKHVQDNNLDVDGLISLLNAQKDAVKAAVPADFIDKSELSAFGWVKKEVVVEEKPKKVKKEKPVKKPKVEKVVEPVVEESTSGGLGFFKWLLPILAILALVWYVLTRASCGGVTDKVATTVAAPIEAVKEVATEATAAVTDVFANVNDAALKALDGISFAAGSAGTQMMDYIKGGATGEGRFRFTNLNFASGSAVIDASSQVEVDNIAAILNAYPGVNVKIEGYTDSQGNPQSNQVLSQQRAEAVTSRLIAAGIDQGRIMADGYGSINPVDTNDTPEGRANNRRIEVVVNK